MKISIYSYFVPLLRRQSAVDGLTFLSKVPYSNIRMIDFNHILVLYKHDAENG